MIKNYIITMMKTEENVKSLRKEILSYTDNVPVHIYDRANVYYKEMIDNYNKIINSGNLMDEYMGILDALYQRIIEMIEEILLVFEYQNIMKEEAGD